MSFASIHVPYFMVQAVVRAEPALGLHPLALVEGAAPHETVVAANRAARKAGIRLSMTKSQAAQFCDVAIRPRSPRRKKPRMQPCSTSPGLSRHALRILS